MQDIKNMLSFRGLQEGFEHPLIEFIGTLQDYNPQPPNEQGRVPVLFNFTDVEVIRSREPYPHPIAQLRILLSDKKRSGWGILGQSVQAIDESLDIPDLVNKRLHMEHTPGHHFGKSREANAEGIKEDIIRDCWELKAIVGGSGSSTVKVDAMTRVLELLDGKNAQQFNQAAFADAIIKTDSSIQGGILDNTLLAGLIASGQITKDDNGIHHVVNKV